LGVHRGHAYDYCISFGFGGNSSEMHTEAPSMATEAAADSARS